MLPALVALLLAQPIGTPEGPVFSSARQKVAFSYAPGVLFQFLPTPVSTECAGAALKGAMGETMSFSRASAAWCEKSDGTMVSLGTNVPRVTTRGLQTEPTSTKLALWNEAIDNAVWTKEGVAVIANAATGPDGVASMELVTADGSSGFHRVYQSFSVTSGTNYVGSATVKAGTLGFAMVQIPMTAVGGCVADLSTCSLAASTAGYQCGVTGAAAVGCRIHAAASATATGTGYVQVHIGSSAAGLTGGTNTSAGTASVWGVDVESGNKPTSHVTVAGTATARQRDIPYVATTGWPAATTGNLSADWTYPYLSGSPSTYGWILDARDGAGGGAGFVALPNAAGQWQTNIGTTTANLSTSPLVSMAFGAKYNVALDWRSGTQKLLVDGVQRYTQGATNMPANWGPNLVIGAYYAVGSTFGTEAGGYISNVKVTQ